MLVPTYQAIYHHVPQDQLLAESITVNYTHWL